MVSTRAVYAAVGCITLMTILAGNAFAQRHPGRFEIGGSLTSIRSADFPASFGPAVEGDFNIGRHVALDAAFNWFPSNSVAGNTTGGLFGVKIGTRTQRFGFFGKARPGFFSIANEFRGSTFNLDTGQASSRFARLTQRALDLGGVIEYYPAQRWSLRWDLGDTLLFQEQGPLFSVIGTGSAFFPSPPRDPTRTTNHFQFSTGVHYLF